MVDFNNLLVGMRSRLVEEATRTGDTEAFSQMQVLFRAYMHADIAVAPVA